MMYWDPILETEAYKEHTESEQVLKPHLYNKDKVGAWRMDIDVDETK